MEAAILDHENERIQLAHLLAAAYELPLGVRRRRRDARPALARARRGPGGDGELRRSRDDRYLPRGPGFPAGDVSLRSASIDSIAVVDGASGEMLGSVEAERAFTTDPSRRRLPAPGPLLRGARARPRRAPCPRRLASTATGTRSRRRRPRSSSTIAALGRRPPTASLVATVRSAVGRSSISSSFGEVSVTEQVLAFQRKRLDDHSVIDLVGARAAGDQLRHPGTLVRAARRARRAHGAAAGGAARRAARHRARPDRGAAAARRCATAGTSAACPRTSTSRPAGRRSSSTTATRGRRASPRRGFDLVRAPGRRRRAADRRVPLRRRLPVLRAEPKCGNLNEPLHKAGALELMEATINVIAATAR